MTYSLEWRHSTPKGTPGRVECAAHLTLDDLQHKIGTLYTTTCWIHVEREDLDFKGKHVTVEELAAQRASKGRK